MKTVLITGVAGLIGSRMADWILKNKPEFEVVGIDNLSGGYEDFINKNIKFYKTDLISEDLSQIFSRHNVVYVYHFAAYAAEGLSPFIRKFNYSNNLVATANVINACITYKVKRLVFTSSMAVYGNGQPPFDENDLPNPIDPYGIAKYACELDIKVAGQQHDLDWCIIRPHNVYGVNQNIWDRYRNVLGIWIYQKLNNGAITIFGDGSQRRAFSNVHDCLIPLWNAAILAEASNQIVNLGSSSEVSILDAAQLLSKIVGGVKITFLEGRHEVHSAYSTHEKSVNILGYKDLVSLEEGLTEMWNWAQLQPKRVQFVWSKYEIEDKLYGFWKIK